MPDELNGADDAEDWSADDEPEESLPPFKPDKRRRNADKAQSSAELRKRMAFYAHRADSRCCSADCRSKAGKKP